MFLPKETNINIQKRLNEHTFFPNEISILEVWSTPKLVIVKALYEEKEIIVTTVTQEGDFLADLIYDCVVNQMFYLMEDIHQGFEFGEEIDQIEQLWPIKAVGSNVHVLSTPKIDLDAAATKLASRFNVKGK